MKNLGSFSGSLLRKQIRDVSVRSTGDRRSEMPGLRDCAERVPVHLCVIPQVNSWLLFGFLGNFKNNLASRVTGRDLFLGLHCFGKREGSRHDHFDFLLVD